MSSPVLTQIPLDRFIAEYWAPQLGQHTALVGPNGCGKTTIGMQLLASMTAQHAQLRGVALVMKPHKGPRSEGRKATGDRTVAGLNRKLGAKVIRNWPPPPIPWRREPPYWALWPEHTGDPRADDVKHSAVFGRCILDCYKKGDSVVFADEAAGLMDDLELEDECKQTLTRGRSMNASMILATQRPKFVHRSMFTEAKHYFWWRMNDEGEYERMREIGSGRLSRREMIDVVSRLKRFQCLYMYPDENIAAILT